jgi:hypothetical protein
MNVNCNFNLISVIDKEDERSSIATATSAATGRDKRRTEERSVDTLAWPGMCVAYPIAR